MHTNIIKIVKRKLLVNNCWRAVRQKIKSASWRASIMWPKWSILAAGCRWRMPRCLACSAVYTQSASHETYQNVKAHFSPVTLHFLLTISRNCIPRVLPSHQPQDAAPIQTTTGFYVGAELTAPDWRRGHTRNVRHHRQDRWTALVVFPHYSPQSVRRTQNVGCYR